MAEQPLDPDELQQAFEVIRRASRDDIHRTIEDLRRRSEEQPGVVQISTSGFSKSGGSVTLDIHNAHHAHTTENVQLTSDVTLPALTMSGTVEVPAVLVDEERAPVMTLERAVKSVILWLVVTGAALAAQGEKGGVETLAWLAAILDAVDGLVGTFKDDDDG